MTRGRFGDHAPLKRAAVAVAWTAPCLPLHRPATPCQQHRLATVKALNGWRGHGAGAGTAIASVLIADSAYACNVIAGNIWIAHTARTAVLDATTRHQTLAAAHRIGSLHFVSETEVGVHQPRSRALQPYPGQGPRQHPRSISTAFRHREATELFFPGTSGVVQPDDNPGRSTYMTYVQSTVDTMGRMTASWKWTSQSTAVVGVGFRGCLHPHLRCRWAMTVSTQIGSTRQSKKRILSVY